MNGNKAKRLRRELREQQAANMAKAPGEFEAMPVIPRELVKSYLLTRFIGKSGYRFISISKPGSHYETEDGKSISIIILHRAFPMYDQNTGRYMTNFDDHPEACVRTSKDFEGFVMDKTMKIFEKGNTEATEGYEPPFSLEKVSIDELIETAKKEGELIEKQQTDQMNTIAARIMTDGNLHDICRKYTADIMKQRFAKHGILYCPDRLVDATGKDITDPAEVIDTFEHYCPKQEITGLSHRFAGIICRLYDKYKTEELDGRSIVTYTMMDYLYSCICKTIVHNGYLVDSDRITIRQNAESEPLSNEDADKLIDETTESIDAWTRLTFINLYNDVLKWYAAGLNNKPYEGNCNTDFDDLKDWMAKKGMPYGKVDGHPCFVKDGKTLPYKEFVGIALEHFGSWQDRMMRKHLAEAKETPL